MSGISVVVGLQESHRPIHHHQLVIHNNNTGEEVRTLIWFLSQGMDGFDHRGSSSSSRWRSIRERFGLKGIACCGGGGGLTTWGTRHSTMSVIDDDDDQDDDYIYQNTPQRRESESMDHPVQELDPVCVDPVAVAGSAMNLATALAAERQYRAAQQDAQLVGSTTVPETPVRISLMRLLEESEGMNGGEVGTTTTARGGGGSSNTDTLCCVCMIRKKGAAFIPCGHTFCRVCSRELWLNRGSCPLCNRSILEILDIF